jgi:hypothetical protein
MGSPVCVTPSGGSAGGGRLSPGGSAENAPSRRLIVEDSGKSGSAGNLANLWCVMRELEAIWKLARADLVVPADDGGSDIFLWEHSARVAKSAQYLSALPEAQANEPDLLALWAAALYHEAGWIARWRAGEIKRHEILLGSPSESIVVESIRIMQKTLDGVIPSPSLTRACETIRYRISHSSDFVEGHILIEADNLEEFGLGFLWMAIRRGICGGKGVQAVLDAWKRRTEYHFWTTRLKDSFRFSATRKLAESRLHQLETLMSEMMIQHEVEDVRNLVSSTRGSPIAPLVWPGETENREKARG